jgi:hypothetical protein
VVGFSRDTFYATNRRENAVVDALINANRRKFNPKNGVEEATEAAIAATDIERHAWITFAQSV